MAQFGTNQDDVTFVNRAVEAAIRIGLLAALIAWCARIVSPFLLPIVWAAILAHVLFPMFRWLQSKLGGRGRLAATLLTLVALATLLVPVALLSTSTAQSVRSIIEGIDEGTLAVPPPPEGVAEWPVVGESVSGAWSLAASNLEGFLLEYREPLVPISSWMASQAAEAGVAVLMFSLAFVIAGFLMASSEAAVSALNALASRLAGEQGAAMVSIAGDTVRSVVLGVLLVAVIQALLAGIGMLVIGVPAAGLWAGLVLILAIMQLPPILVLAPVIVYVFSTSSTLTAVLFMIFALAVGFSDAFLKPLFLGRGVAVPMPVILIGALGGMVMAGIIGLFVGAVVLAIGYQITVAWVRNEAPASEGNTETPG